MTDQELMELFLSRSGETAPVLQAQYGPYGRAIRPARPERFKGWLGAIVRNRALWPRGQAALDSFS